ncbi:MAG TPA: hypothetical protein VJK90_02895 [Acetobacteraceae bacterium]|nr:hypothetical protein [Acetobacteraceae bacterium]
MISQPSLPPVRPIEIRPVQTRPVETSPLTLSDHLITLAEEADRAGYTNTARRLVNLACTVFDEAATLRPH